VKRLYVVVLNEMSSRLTPQSRCVSSAVATLIDQRLELMKPFFRDLRGAVRAGEPFAQATPSIPPAQSLTSVTF